MLLVPCPYCGPRPEIEFRCGGEAHIAAARPGDGDATRTGRDYLYYRTNPKGPHRERWHHLHGCGRWFNAVRDTVSDQFEASYRIGETPPGESTTDGRLCRPAAGSTARARSRFTFDGRAMQGFAGDTLASALLANGVHLVGRSFKYHRPRGIMTAGAEEPSALIQLERPGGRSDPNLRATEIELYRRPDRDAARTAGRRSRFDVGAVDDLLSPLLPAGFYYKTFLWPARWWTLGLRAVHPRAPPGWAARRPGPTPTATCTATPIATCWWSAAGRPG